MKNTKETIIEDVNLIQQFKESSEYNTYKQSIQFDFNEEFVIEDNLVKLIATTSKNDIFIVELGRMKSKVFKPFKRSQATRNKMSASHKNKTLSLEVRERIGLSQQGRRQSDVTKQLISEKNKNHPVSESARLAISEANKGTKRDSFHILKMKNGLKKFWIKKKTEQILNNIVEGECLGKFMITQQVINNKQIVIKVQLINEKNLNIYINDKEEDTLITLTTLISMAFEENPKAKIQVYTTNN